MRFIIIALLFTVSVLMTSCATPSVVSGKISFRDGKKNDYLVDYEDNEEAKKFKALVDVKGKTYSCEVDYTEAPADAFGIDIDVSALDITGKIKFTYKKVTVECSVANDITDAETAAIIKADEAKTETPAE